MSNPLEWHRFKFKSWAGDESIRRMSLEQVGAYWILLVNQMFEGSIPADMEGISEVLGKPAVDAEYVKDRLWKKLEPHFVPVADKPNRLHNPSLTKIVKEDMEKANNYKKAGKKSAQVRYGSPVEEQEEVQAAVFDFTPILKEYPPRNKTEGGRISWNKGIRMMENYISTQEDFDLLFAAVKRYKKSRNGQDRQFTKSLPTFMTEWTDWIPEGMRESYRADRASLEPAEESRIEVTESHETSPSQNQRGSQMVKNDRTVWEQPPWERSIWDTDESYEKVKEQWTEEAKKRWLEGNG